MKVRVFIAGVSLLVAAAACSDGGGSPTGPSTQPFSQTVTGSVAGFGTARHPLTTARAGSMTLRLTWSDPAVDLDLYLTASGCTTNLYPMSTCGIVAASDAPQGTTTETIARGVANQEAFQIWVDNLHPATSMNYTLTIEID